jgi:hypothetical protein
LDHLVGQEQQKISNKPASTLQLIDGVNLSLWWLKEKISNIAFDYHTWGFSPLLCMGIG